MAVHPDDDFLLYNKVNPYKAIRFDLSTSPIGGITSFFTPGSAGKLALDHSLAFTYYNKTTSIAPTIIWADAPTGIYMLQVTVTKFSGAGTISVTPTWDGGTKDENLITTFS